MVRKDIKRQILDFFLIHPTQRLRVRQIEREAKAPLPSVITYTKELEQAGILQSVVIAGVKLYLANRTSSSFKLEKKLFNLRSLQTSGLLDFFIDYYDHPTIIVFGSYALGEDIEGSDIDLYIETSSTKMPTMDHFEKLLQRKIQLFTYKKITSIKNKKLANSIINGVILTGFIEVF